MKKNTGSGQVSAEIHSGRILLIIFACLFSIEVLLFVLDYLINWQEASSRESIRKMFGTSEEHSIAIMQRVY